MSESGAGALGASALAAVLSLWLTSCAEPVARGQLRAEIDALERPNLLLIVVDTLRADWTTPYGFAKDTSPELARWAARGVLFERAMAQSSWTKISMASLMTSLWPRSHGIREARDGLAEGATTLAELLRETGYQTAAVQTNGWLDQSFGFQQGFERYVFPGSSPDAVRRFGRSSLWPHADKVVEETVRLIDAFDRQRPFFLYLHFMDVHEYAAPPEFKRFGSDARGAYLASIRWVDDALGRVRETIDRAGRLDETVIVFAADHGEAFGENGRQGHARNVLSAVIHVPLVIRFPFPVEPVRIASQVRNVDVAPTLLEIAGVPVPASFEGSSLLSLVTGEAEPRSRTSHAALGTPLYRDASIQVSMTDGTWTFARNLAPEPQRAEFLFDRSVDPGENVNLVEREAARARELRDRLDRHLAEDPAPEALETGVRIDPSIAERLRAMGYLQ